MVNMAEQEIVDRAVPFASELIPGDGIPPVRVEASVSEAS